MLSTRVNFMFLKLNRNYIFLMRQFSAPNISLWTDVIANKLRLGHWLNPHKMMRYESINKSLG